MLCVFLTLFLAGLGACIGSFLNVVVYRLPRGMSVVRPRRSFCPSCGQAIHWYDNIPLASWMALGGRCRSCDEPISVQYPIVEAAAVILTMLLWQWAREAYGSAPAEQWWPVLAGVLGLFYCLLALSAMDLEAYHVDIRLTWLALAIGLIAHAVSSDGVWPTAEPIPAAWAAFAVGCTVALAVLHRLWPMPPEPVEPTTEPQDGVGSEPPPAQPAPDTPPEEPTGTVVAQSPPTAPEPSAAEPSPAGQPAHPPVSAGRRFAFPVTLVIVAVVFVVVQLVSCAAGIDSAIPRTVVGMGLAGLFGSILAGSWLATEADEAIAEAVEVERPAASRQAVSEGLMLLMVALAGLGLAWLAGRPSVAGRWADLLGWAPLEGWRPMRGLAAALFGWVVAGGACWLIRVAFTLLLRKEALGFGDIHVVAAAGAVLGPHLAIAGFFLAAPVALAGTLVLVFRKSYRTLPFGPWLSMGFLLAVLWGRPLVAYINEGIRGLRLLLGS